MFTWYIGNSAFLIGFFLASLAICLIVFRPLKGKRHPEWKFFDLGIILVGSLGLFSLSFQASVTKAQLELPFRQSWVTYYRSEIQRLIPQVDIICVPHPALPSSPPNNQDIEDDRRQVCEWATSNFKIPGELIIQGKGEVFDAKNWKPFPKLKTWVDSLTAWEGDGKWYRDVALAWDQNVAAIKKITNPAPWDAFDLTLIFFGPYILAMAIAAQITKILYEQRD